MRFFTAAIPTGLRFVKRSRTFLFFALLFSLATALTLWWAWLPSLSPTERQLVGVWQHEHGPRAGAPNGSTRFWHLAEDRSCHIEDIDAASGQILAAMAGRWSAENGRLVCDWEGNALARARRMLPRSWTGMTSTKLDPYVIDAVNEGEVVLRSRGGPVMYPLQRVEER